MFVCVQCTEIVHIFHKNLICKAQCNTTKHKNAGQIKFDSNTKNIPYYTSLSLLLYFFFFFAPLPCDFPDFPDEPPCLVDLEAAAVVPCDSLGGATVLAILTIGFS